MSFSAVGTLASDAQLGLTTLAVTPQAAGDVLVVGMKITSVTITITSITGGGATGWTRIGGPANDGIRSQELWLGTVTATGSQTITVTFSSSNTGIVTDLDAQEFSSSSGPIAVWAGDTSGSLSNAASTTITYPTLAPGISGTELYVAQARVPGGSGYSGLSAGFTDVGPDVNSNPFIYGLAVTGSVSPTETDAVSAASFALAALITGGHNDTDTVTGTDGGESVAKLNQFATNGAQSAASGTTVTPANSGDAADVAFDTVSLGTGTTLAYDSAQAAHGTQAFKLATSATSAAAYAAWSSAVIHGSGSVSEMWVRAYVYLTGVPANNFRLFSFFNGSTFAAGLSITVSSSSTGEPGLRWQNSSFATILNGALSLPFGAWFRVEAAVLSSPGGSSGQVEYKLFLTPDSLIPDEIQTSAATQSVGTALTQARYGITSATASLGPLWIDDVGVSTAGYLGPTGRSDGDTAIFTDDPLDIDDESGGALDDEGGGDICGENAVLVVSLSGTDTIAGAESGGVVTIPAAGFLQTPLPFTRPPGLVSPHGFLLPMPTWQQEAASVSVFRAGSSELAVATDAGELVDVLSADSGSGDDEVSVLQPSIADFDVAGGSDSESVLNLAIVTFALPATQFSPGLASPAGWLRPLRPSWQQAQASATFSLADGDVATGTDLQHVAYTFVNYAESGTPGTTVTPANSGDPADNAFDVTVITSPSVLAYDSAQAAHGAQSFKISSTTAAAAWMAWTTSFLPSPVTQVWFRFYAFLTGTPGTSFHIFTAENGTSLAAALNVTNTGHLRWVNSAEVTIGTGTVSLPLSSWFRVEGYVITSATAGVVEYKLFTAADSTTADETLTFTSQNTSTAITAPRYGLVNSVASIGPLWLDDIAASTVGYIGPTLQALSDSDVGAGSEAALIGPPPDADSGSGADSTGTVAPQILDSDTGSALDAGVITPQPVLALYAPGLAHPGVFAFPPPLAWQQLVGDTSHAGAIAFFNAADTGSFADVETFAAKVDADASAATADGSETIALPTAGPPQGGVEVPSFREADPPVIGLADTDAVSGAEAFFVGIPDSDGASGNDVSGTTALAGSDTFSGSDTQSATPQGSATLLVTRPPGLVSPPGFLLPMPSWQQLAADSVSHFSVTGNDAGQGSDGSETIAPPAGADAGTGFDTGNWSVADTDTGHGEDLGTSLVTDADGGSGTEATGAFLIGPAEAETPAGTDVELSSHPADSDSGSGTETLQALSGPFADTDSCHGTDTARPIVLEDGDAFTEADEDPGLIDVWPVQITWTGGGWFRVVWHPHTPEEVEIFRTKAPTRAHFALHEEINRFGLTLLSDSDTGSGTDASFATADVSAAILESAALSAGVPGEVGAPGQFGWASGFPAQAASADEDGER